MILVYLNIKNKKHKLLGGEDIDLIKDTVFGTASSQNIFDKIILCRQHFADYEKKSKEYIECRKIPNKDCTTLKDESSNFSKQHNDCLYKNSVEYKNKLLSIWKKEKNITLDISEFLPVNKDTIALNKPKTILNEKGEKKKIIPVTEVNTFKVLENKDIYKNLGILTLKSNKTVRWTIEPIDDNIETPSSMSTSSTNIIDDGGTPTPTPTPTTPPKKNIGDHDYFKIVYNSITGNDDLLKSTILFDYEKKNEYKFNITAEDLHENTLTKTIIIEVINIDDTPPKIITDETIYIPEEIDSETITLPFSGGETPKPIHIFSAQDQTEPITWSWKPTDSSEDINTFPFKPTLETGKLYLKNTTDWNYENKDIEKIYKITITAVDNTNAKYSSSKDVTIKINDIDENSPIFKDNASSIIINKNNPPTSKIIHTFKIDDKSLIKSYELDNSKYFELESNNNGETVDLKYKSGFEILNEPQILKITVADIYNNKTTKQFTITMRDTENPIIIGNTSIQINQSENFSSWKSPPYTINDKSLPLRVVLEGTDKDKFEINQESGSYFISFKNSSNISIGTYTVKIKAFDYFKNMNEQTVDITIKDNIPPQITLENEQTITKFDKTIDHDTFSTVIAEFKTMISDEKIIWKLEGSVNDTLFEINEKTGVLKYIGNEKKLYPIIRSMDKPFFDFTLSATDINNNKASIPIKITIKNENSLSFDNTYKEMSIDSNLKDQLHTLTIKHYLKIKKFNIENGNGFTLKNSDYSGSYQLEYTKDNYESSSYNLKITFEDIAGNISNTLTMEIFIEFNNSSENWGYGSSEYNAGYYDYHNEQDEVIYEDTYGFTKNIRMYIYINKDNMNDPMNNPGDPMYNSMNNTESGEYDNEDHYYKIDTSMEVLIDLKDSIENLSLKTKEGEEIYDSREMFLQDITMYGNSNIIEKSKKFDINIYDDDEYNDINISKYMLFTLKKNLELDIAEFFEQDIQKRTINLNTSDIYILEMPGNDPYSTGIEPYFLSRLKGGPSTERALRYHLK